MLSVPLRSYSISPSKVTLETSYFYCNGFRFVDRKYGRPIVKYGRPITIEQSTNRGLLSIDCHISRLSVDIATWDTWSTQDTSFGVKNNLSQNLLSACEFCDVYSFFKGGGGERILYDPILYQNIVVRAWDFSLEFHNLLDFWWIRMGDYARTEGLPVILPCCNGTVKEKQPKKKNENWKSNKQT